MRKESIGNGTSFFLNKDILSLHFTGDGQETTKDEEQRQQQQQEQPQQSSLPPDAPAEISLSIPTQATVSPQPENPPNQSSARRKTRGKNMKSLWHQHQTLDSTSARRVDQPNFAPATEQHAEKSATWNPSRDCTDSPGRYTFPIYKKKIASPRVQLAPQLPSPPASPDNEVVANNPSYIPDTSSISSNSNQSSPRSFTESNPPGSPEGPPPPQEDPLSLPPPSKRRRESAEGNPEEAPRQSSLKNLEMSVNNVGREFFKRCMFSSVEKQANGKSKVSRCPKSFHRADDYEAHLVTTHFQAAPKEFTRINLLDYPSMCEFCDHMFLDPTERFHHFAQSHYELAVRFCVHEDCRRAFVSLKPNTKGYRVHSKQWHPGKSDFHQKIYKPYTTLLATLRSVPSPNSFSIQRYLSAPGFEAKGKDMLERLFLLNPSTMNDDRPANAQQIVDQSASMPLQRGWCDEVPSSSRLPLQESWPPGAAEAKRGGARPIAVGIPSVKGKARKRTQQEINEAEEERRLRREGNRWEYEDLENPPRS